jgi:hypothetical protein
LNRNASLLRDFQSEGSERSMQLATALAQIADPDFLERVIHLKSSLDAWGGEAYIAAERRPLDPATGRICDHNTPGREYATLGYITHYGHRVKGAIRGAVEEPDEPLGVQPGEGMPSQEPEPVQVEEPADLTEAAELAEPAPAE